MLKPASNDRGKVFCILSSMLSLAVGVRWWTLSWTKLDQSKASHFLPSTWSYHVEPAPYIGFQCCLQLSFKASERCFTDLTLTEQRLRLQPKHTIIWNAWLLTNNATHTSSSSFVTSFWIISLLHNNKPTDQNVLCNSTTNQMSFHSSHSLSHSLYTHIHQKKHTNTLWPVTVTNSNMTHMFQLCVGELASLAGCLSSGFLCLPALPVFNIVRDVVNSLLKHKCRVIKSSRHQLHCGQEVKDITVEKSN